ncbi:YcxB family protein [Bengtsoniella intestinalis]|uniref:YcxB family protein n=1 Tax=Bengtsoniella intestinalis TaxID=3073143 RepID=UPI00391F6C1A
MQQILQFTTSYTVQQMTIFNRIASKIYPNPKGRRRRIFNVVLGTFGVVISALTYQSGGALWLVAMSCIVGLWYLVAAVWHYRIMGQQSYQARPKGVEFMRFTFDKSGMVVENATGYSRFTFDEVKCVAEGKTLFVLFTSEAERQGYLIPKEDLPSVDAFRVMMETQYGCKVEQFKC